MRRASRFFSGHRPVAKDDPPSADGRIHSQDQARSIRPARADKDIQDLSEVNSADFVAEKLFVTGENFVGETDEFADCHLIELVAECATRNQAPSKHEYPSRINRQQSIE